MGFILNLPAPNFSTGVEDGIAVARVTKIAGNNERKRVQHEPNKRRFFVV